MNIQNISNNFNSINLFIRNEDGSLSIKEINDFYPYYYQKTSDKQSDAISIYKEPLKKIYCRFPHEVRKQSNLDSYESDIPFTKRYILDKIPEFTKSPTKICYLDIEVDCKELPHPKEDKCANDPVSVITVYNNYSKEYKTFYIKDYKTEYEMLESFCRYMKEEAFDIILAWNIAFDWYYLYHRLNMELPTVISPIGKEDWRSGNIFPAGTSIVDMQGLYAKYTLHKKDSYALMYVAKEELGYEIEEDFDFTDVEVAKGKNILDVKKMVELDAKLNLIEYFDEIRLLTRVFWEELPSEMRNYQWQSNNSKVIDMLALAEGKRLNVVLPNKNRDDDEERTMEGAYRKVTETGIHKDLAKVDVGSAYPSMIIDFCLSPENFVEKEEENTIKIEVFSRELRELKSTYYVKQDSNAVLPSLVKRLLVLKNELKEKLNSAEADSEEQKKLQIKYDSRKALVNTSFGCIALPFFRLYDQRNGDTITFLARDLLHFVEDKLEKQNKKIQYVDTDSLFIEGKENISTQLNNWAIEWAMDRYNNPKSQIQFDYEGFFSSIFLIAMCRYRGRLETKKGQKIEDKGLQLKRKDSSKWVKVFQEELLNKLLDLESKEEVLKFIRKKMKDLKDSALIDVGIPCKINKPKEFYKKKEIFFEALEETQKICPDFKKEIGDKFYWIYTLKQRVLAFDRKHENLIDRNDVNWQEMTVRSIFNILVPIFKGLKWEIDLLELAENEGIVLGSEERNKLLEGREDFEEKKLYYSAREAKKRMKEETINKNQLEINTFAEEVSKETRLASSQESVVRVHNSAPKKQKIKTNANEIVEEENSKTKFIIENNEVIGIKSKDLTLKVVDSKIVDPMVKKYHYSHKTTKNRFLSFTVNEDKGFLQLGYGIRPNLKKSIHPLIDSDNFCEFDRMWLSDDLPKFSESQVISLLLKFIKVVYPNIKFIITYADGSVGNTGVIYKATNAFIIGKVGVDFYILPSGERIHPVSMWHRHKTRAWKALQELYPGIKHIKNTEYQYRFLYILDKKLWRDFNKSRKVKL